MAAKVDQLDLRSLRVLSALANTRNTYRAAEQLHLSQSAVSRALGRLRDILEEPLFVRCSGGMEPTEKAERIVGRQPELLEMLDSVVAGESQFEPANWQGNVSLALSSLAMVAWGKTICDQLNQLAPDVILNLKTWDSNTVRDILEGRVTLGVHYRNDKWPQALFQEALAEDEYVLMAHERNEAVRGNPTLALIRKHSLISWLLPEWNDYNNRLESALGGLGIEPQIQLRTDNLGLAVERLRSSDCLMAGTRAMTEQFEDLHALPYPTEIQLPDSSVVICYPRRSRSSPRLNWLTRQIPGVVS